MIRACCYGNCALLTLLLYELFKKKKNPINCDVGSYLSYCIVIKILSTCILVERETLKKISSVKSGE